MTPEQAMETISEGIRQAPERPPMSRAERGQAIADYHAAMIRSTGSVHDCTATGSVVESHYVDRRGRVWFKLNSGKEIRGKRFMSRRIAKRWALKKYGTVFLDLSITPVMPVEYITFTSYIVPTD